MGKQRSMPPETDMHITAGKGEQSVILTRAPDDDDPRTGDRQPKREDARHPPGTHAILYSEGETGQSDESGRVHEPRKVSRTVLNYAVIAIVVGSVMAAFLMGDSKIVLLGLLVFIPYAFLLIAPVLLARASGVNKKRNDP